MYRYFLKLLKQSKLIWVKSRNQADFHTLVDCIFSAIRGMPHISNKQFINELSKMHRSVSYLGVVSISFKRCICLHCVWLSDNKGVNCFPSKKDAEPNSKKNRCLVRAVSPHKKISTIVGPYITTLIRRLLLMMLHLSVMPSIVYSGFLFLWVGNS